MNTMFISFLFFDLNDLLSPLPVEDVAQEPPNEHYRQEKPDEHWGMETGIEARVAHALGLGKQAK